jgi:predicted Zn-dependent protease
LRAIGSAFARAVRQCQPAPSRAKRGRISQPSLRQEIAMAAVEPFLAMLERGQDSALLRFSLGNEYLKRDAPEQAIAHLARALEQDPGYSAAWKLYGKALAALGEHERALEVFDQGIAQAESKGDVQAAKEMRVFRKRAAVQARH